MIIVQLLLSEIKEILSDGTEKKLNVETDERNAKEKNVKTKGTYLYLSVVPQLNGKDKNLFKNTCWKNPDFFIVEQETNRNSNYVLRNSRIDGYSSEVMRSNNFMPSRLSQVVADEVDEAYEENTPATEVGEVTNMNIPRHEVFLEDMDTNLNSTPQRRDITLETIRNNLNELQLVQNESINQVIQREEQLDSMHDKSEDLTMSSMQFQRCAKSVRTSFMGNIANSVSSIFNRSSTRSVESSVPTFQSASYNSTEYFGQPASSASQ